MLYQPPYSKKSVPAVKKNDIGHPLLVTFKMLFKTVLLLVTSLKKKKKTK